MPQVTCEIDAPSIVMRGALNPAIFQPAWFAANELIPQVETKEAEVQIISKEVTDFRLKWLHVQVTGDRFLAEVTDSANQSTLRDLVVGTFTLLSHTPIQAMGLNRLMHWRMPSDEKWHSFGHLVTPKDIWRDVLDEPGMLSVTMQGRPKESSAKSINVKLQPSLKVKPGIYLEVNSDYRFEDTDSDSGAGAALKHLQDDWEDAQSFAQKVAKHLLSDQDYLEAGCTHMTTALATSFAYEHDSGKEPNRPLRNVSTTLRHPRAAFSEPRLASGDS